MQIMVLIKLNQWTRGLYAWPCKPQTIQITWRWNICKIHSHTIRLWKDFSIKQTNIVVTKNHHSNRTHMKSNWYRRPYGIKPLKASIWNQTVILWHHHPLSQNTQFIFGKMNFYFYEFYTFLMFTILKSSQFHSWYVLIFAG